MKQYIFFFIFFVSLGVNSLAQSVSDTGSKNVVLVVDSNSIAKEVSFIKGLFVDFEIDALQNIYVQSYGGLIKKINAQGDSIGVYNDVRHFGRADKIDASNPLQILIYYRDFGNIVLLDRLLAQRNFISLRSKEFFWVNAITASYDNNIWIFDEQDFKIKKINIAGNLLTESNDLRTFLNRSPKVENIIDAEKKLYLYDSKYGFYQFEYNGSYQKLIVAEGLKSTGFNYKYLYGFKDGKLILFSPDTNLQTQINIDSSSEIEGIKISGNQIYVLQKDGIKILSFPQF